MRLRLRLLLERTLLLRCLRLLKRRLRLLRLGQLRRRSSAESRACSAAANIAAARVDRACQMICQTQPARRYHDEKLGILERAAF